MRDKILLPEVERTFLKEWSDRQFVSMRYAIFNHFMKKGGVIFNGEKHQGPLRYSELENLLGLAYSSCSSYAGYWVCNGDITYNDEYRYIGFAISKLGTFCAICWSENEKELIIEL